MITITSKWTDQQVVPFVLTLALNAESLLKTSGVSYNAWILHSY